MRTLLRPYRLVVLVVVMLSLLSPLSVKAQDSTITATVSAPIISLQGGPGLNYSSVGTAQKGQKFPVRGRATGTKRIWYEIALPDGNIAWVSQRVVIIDPSPSSLPWVGTNSTKTPELMDCGHVRPLLFVDAYAQVISPTGVALTNDSGIGKTAIGSVAQNDYVLVEDGPFCTLISADKYQIEWVVLNKSGVTGYMLESLPNGNSPYVKLTLDAPSDFPTPSAPLATADAPTTSDRPAGLTDDDVQRVTDIFNSVALGKLKEAQATDKLQAVVTDRGSEILAWIVRHVPIYDGKTGSWVSMSRYEDETLMIYNLQSDLDNDPVTTTINILFGKYTDEKSEFQAIGCGG
jgi:hypothetical protein